MDKIEANKDSAPELGSSVWFAGLINRMEAEAKQFNECARIHEHRGNRNASAVADRAGEIILRFIGELRQANTDSATRR